ncbi:septation protein A [Jeongeupia wiesaeckerbachi]|uniref:septation protein A n=1 Tax=Jeongeupia wiesaeckerbachi TaxID=3051218 RepID=UPI003D8035FA
MKFLFDLFPILLFFGAYSITHDLFLATAVAIVTTGGQVVYSWIRWRKVEPTLWLSFGLVTVLGGATLLLHDKTFIFWKPTALYWVFSVLLLGAKWLRNQNLMQKLMGQQLQLPQPVWDKVNLAWALFFAAMGVLNLFVAFHFGEDIWVKFKLFGTLGLTLLFVLGQGLVLSRYLDEAAPEQGKE